MAAAQIASRASQYVSTINSVDPQLWKGCYFPYRPLNFEGQRPGFQAFWKTAFSLGHCLMFPEDLYTHPGVWKPGSVMSEVYRQLGFGPEAARNFIVLGKQFEKDSNNVAIPWRSRNEFVKRAKDALTASSTTFERGATARSWGVWFFAESGSNPDWFSSHPWNGSPNHQHKHVTDGLLSLLPWPQP